MSEAMKKKWYDPVGERMYILGALRVLLEFDPTLDDPAGILDDVIDGVLIDAFKFGWMSKQTLEKP